MENSGRLCTVREGAGVAERRAPDPSRRGGPAIRAERNIVGQTPVSDSMSICAHLTVPCEQVSWVTNKLGFCFPCWFGGTEAVEGTASPSALTRAGEEKTVSHVWVVPKESAGVHV